MNEPTLIAVNNITWSYPGEESLLSGVSLSFGNDRIGIVGSNGCGKSTLLKVLIGEYVAESGRVSRNCSMGYLPQSHESEPDALVSDVLGITDKLFALDNISKGSTENHYYELLNDDWGIRERAGMELGEFGLAHISLDRKMGSLSGGENTRTKLASLWLQSPDLLVLDEPTNHLDMQARESLYRRSKNWSKGLVVVSHDRKLLGSMDKIIEISRQSISQYSGTFSDYEIYKEAQRNAVTRQIKDADKKLEKSRREAQVIKQKFEKSNSRGKKSRTTGSQSKLLLNAKKERAESTGAVKTRLTERKVDDAITQLQVAKTRTSEQDYIRVASSDVSVPNGKRMLEIEDLSFTYGKDKAPTIDGLSAKVMGSERVWLTGKNGSGKSTLLKLISGAAVPQKGTVHIGAKRLAYLDQDIALLKSDKSVLDNCFEFNPSVSETELRTHLSYFLFSSEEVNTPVSELSGGEKIRAAFACLMVKGNTPDLLLLDEATNCLDMDSISVLEEIINNYNGALIVVSHDSAFVENINITKEICLEDRYECRYRKSSISDF